MPVRQWKKIQKVLHEQAETGGAVVTKSALISGLTGQCGWYLSQLLLDKGYRVHGLVRHVSSRASAVDQRVVIHEADLLDQGSLIRAMEAAEPDEVYNLASLSYVPVSWAEPVTVGDITGLGVTRMLEAVRQVNPKIRFYQANSSEMFGLAEIEPQNEQTPFRPRSPYGAAKLYAHSMTVNYRESYGIFACSGILFNHESPHRGKEFVTRKITLAVAKAKVDRRHKVRLGNLHAKRDWGYAADYTRAAWLMLQQEEPDDYVVATGETHSVREFAEAAFEHVGLEWQEHVEIDPTMLRPAEIWTLRGDATKARERLGWEPTVDFIGLVALMVDADLAAQGVTNA